MVRKDTRPLFRWTIGNVNGYGFEALRLSVRKVRELFGDKAEYVICHNSLEPFQMKFISRLNTPLLDQRFHIKSLPFRPDSVAWKLYPPRIKFYSHEIFIDNDLIMWAKPPQLETFLASDDCLVFTEGNGRNYGVYKDMMRKYRLKVNTGIFGIPPFFPLREKLAKIMRKSPYKKWKGKYDEQGALAYLISQNRHIQIPVTEIRPIRMEEQAELDTNSGYHFVFLNRGWARSWMDWKTKKMKLL